MQKLALLAFLMTVMSGCATVATQQRWADQSFVNHAESTDEPLFSFAGDKLNDEQINRILNYRLSLPKENRIAILPLPGRGYAFSRFSSVHITPQIRQNLIVNLRNSSRVYDASFLPNLLLPEKRTVPALREAAARYQADMLLAYRSSCDSFDRFRLFAKDKVKATCTIEFVLLDVRSGLVPFTAVSSKVFELEQKKHDFDLRETIIRGELGAAADAFGDLVGELKTFLNGVPLQ